MAHLPRDGKGCEKDAAGRATCNGHCDASKGTAGTPSSREEQTTKRAERPRVRTRGSSGTYAPARLSTPSLGLPQPSTGVYIPTPISNPSGQINQLNHSFPLNGGLGNNPTGRDAYIRYNLTR